MSDRLEDEGRAAGDGAGGPACRRLAERFDLLDPEQVADPYALLAESRRNCPVFYSPKAGAWILTRYDDIVAVAADTERFSSRDANKTTQAVPPEVAEINALVHREVRALVDADPPRHTRLRKLVNQAFTPPRIRAMEPAIRRTATELVDRFAGDGRADLQRQFAVPLPLVTILRILGLPDHDADRIRIWSIDYNNERSPSLSLDERLAYTHGVAALRLHLASAVEERRARPQDDTITHLVQAEVDGDRLSTWEIASVLHALVFAGHETTIGLIGALVYHLLRHREDWEAVKADPGIRSAAVEEALRREGSVTGMFRTAETDVEIHGVRIPKGARVQLMFASAGHDERYFPDPLRFDIRRKRPKDHLAFGLGRHYCLGAPLARAEARIALDVLCDRIPTLRLSADTEERTEFLPSALFRARTAMPVEWDVAPSPAAATANPARG